MIRHIVKDLREEDTVLLMDNCSPDISPVVIAFLSIAHVRVILVTFAP
jgi:hypothetical protein